MATTSRKFEGERLSMYDLALMGAASQGKGGFFKKLFGIIRTLFSGQSYQTFDQKTFTRSIDALSTETIIVKNETTSPMIINGIDWYSPTDLEYLDLTIKNSAGEVYSPTGLMSDDELTSIPLEYYNWVPQGYHMLAPKAEIHYELQNTHDTATVVFEHVTWLTPQGNHA